MDKITLPNGIVLNLDGRWAKSVQDYASDLGLEGIRIFLATHPSGWQEYVIVEGESVVYADTNFESVCAHLDIMEVTKKFGCG